MRLVFDKKSEKNYKLVALCSQVKTIELTYSRANIEKKHLDFLNRPENRSFRNYLSRTYQLQAEALGDPIIIERKDPQKSIPFFDETQVPINILSSVVVDNPKSVPSMYREQYKTHLSNVKAINRKSDTIDELQELRETIFGRRTRDIPTHNSMRHALKLMNDTEGKSKEFVDFCEDMQIHNPMLINLVYKHRALKVAEKANLLGKNSNIEAFYDKLHRSFNVDDVITGFKSDVKGRFFDLGKTILPIAATVGISAAVILSNINKDTQNVPGETTSYSTMQTENTNAPAPNENIIDTAIIDDGFVKPLSDSNIHDYKTACDDFLKKTAEIYHEQTGDTFSFAGYEQSDFGYSSSSTFILAKLPDGSTRRFSTQSGFRTNITYLEKALTSAGIPFEYYSAPLTYIANSDNVSVAITDGTNGVYSGKILEYANGGGEMYNQTYVSRGKAIAGNQNLSDAEAVGTYLASDEFKKDSKQNIALGSALGKTSPLAKFIKDSFYERNGQEDQGAINSYCDKSKTFKETYNESARIEYMRSISSDSFEIVDASEENDMEYGD